MQVYINNKHRADIIPLVGGSLEQTAEHKTTSKISVKLPSDPEKDIRECDYIKLVNNGVVVHAGTILGISQQEIGQNDLGFKIYDLTITSNSDFISSVLVDLVFPAGASISNVLFGNHKDVNGPYFKYYNKDLYEFFGIIESRIEPEGIVKNVIDDFSTFILSEPATLWGSYVDDILDSLCKTAGAWWEITNDKKFNMRYDISRENTPIRLSPYSEVYDLQTTRDAYTLYSAVRVIGGKGQGQRLKLKIESSNNLQGYDMAIYESNTILKLKYPFYKDMKLRYKIGANCENILTVGVQGIDDDNVNCDYLVSYGGTEVKAKSGKTFPPLPTSANDYLNIEYDPLVPIIIRLVDNKLVEEIKSQREGTGLIEYILKDDAIVDFPSAISAGNNFLKNGSGRAFSIQFKTLLSGFTPGQLLKNSYIPLYGVVGDYKITSVTSSTVSENNIEYTVSASTSAYNDSLKSLFYNPKKISFKLGDDFPAVDGVCFNNEISINSFIGISAYNLPTCDEHELKEKTCSDWESDNFTWREILGAVKTWEHKGNFITSAAKKELIKILSGSPSKLSFMLPNNLYITDKKVGVGDKISTYEQLTATHIIKENDSLTSQYFISSARAKFLWDYLYVGDVINKLELNQVTSDWLQEIDISIDRSNYNYDFIIDKTDSIKDTYFNDLIRKSFVDLFSGESTDTSFKVNERLSIYGRKNDNTIIDLLRDSITNLDHTIKENSIITTFYIDQFDLTDSKITKLVFENNNNQTHSINVDIDKRKNVRGEYSLTITKKDEVI